jgi:uncharacterized short protein YbdD (DUF466 family)
MIALLKPFRYMLGYLREISGENAYDRYVVVHMATHTERPPMSRGEFYLHLQDDKYNNPGNRCPC